MASTTPRVLIVGAGPAGLTLAIALRLHGIPIRLIEKAPTYHIGQRGAGIQPRTIELFNLLGVKEELDKHHLENVQMRKYILPGGTEIEREWPFRTNSKPTPSVPYPNTYLCGQARSEPILRARLESLGGFVELGTAFRDLKQQDGSVTAFLVKTSQDGTEIEEQAEFEYVVGTDGGRGQVRRSLGLKYEGSDKAVENMVTGDIEVTGGIKRDAWHFWGDGMTGQVSSLRPTQEDNNEYTFIFAGHFDYEKVASGREELIQAFYEHTGRTDITFGKLVWISLYQPKVRMLQEFQLGRVFVAGDAAHVHSATGGQGLNTSVQDAFNLGWKLALVLSGLSSPSLLDTYTSERVPVVAEMLSLTTKLLRLAQTAKTQADTAKAWSRGDETSMLGVNYRGSPIVLEGRPGMHDDVLPSAYVSDGLVKAGDRAPDAPGLFPISHTSGSYSLFADKFKPHRHSTLVFLPSTNGTKQLITDIAKQFESLPPVAGRPTFIYRASVDASEVPHAILDLSFKDGQGHAFKGYGILDQPSVVIVRPDGVIGAFVLDAEGISTYFSKIFTKV